MTMPKEVAEVLSGERQWTVVHGDSFDVLSLLPNGKVDHCITDPPYSAHVHSKSRAGARKTPLKDGNGRITRCAIEREVDFGFDPITHDEIETFADHAERLVTRWTMCFCDVESVHLWKGAFESAGLDYCRTGAWVKIGATPQFTGDRPGIGFEALAIAHPKGKKRWNGGGSHAVWTHLTCQERGGQAFTSNNTRVHETQKPLALMLELVEQFTNPNDVLDPFAGSGTTVAACIRLGRRCIGIEKKAEHAAVAIERCEAEASGSSLRAARAGQGSLFGDVR